MIHRVGNCFGLTLWRAARRHVELWLCFSAVPPHTHPGLNAEIVPLFGWSKFFRVVETVSADEAFPGCPVLRVEGVAISPRTWLRTFRIPAGWIHWFTGVPVVFLNLNDSGESAGVNFVTADRQLPLRRVRSRLFELA